MRNWLAILFRRVACALAGHPNKRIVYWLVKPERGAANFHGWNSFVVQGAAQDGAPFAVIDFGCPDCNRAWFTEIS